jgi:hypothetical protein
MAREHRSLKNGVRLERSTSLLSELSRGIQMKFELELSTTYLEPSTLSIRKETLRQELSELAFKFQEHWSSCEYQSSGSVSSIVVIPL